MARKLIPRNCKEFHIDTANITYNAQMIKLSDVVINDDSWSSALIILDNVDFSSQPYQKYFYLQNDLPYDVMILAHNNTNVRPYGGSYPQFIKAGRIGPISLVILTFIVLR